MPQKTNVTPSEWYQCLNAGTAAVRHPYEVPQFRRLGWPRLCVFHIPSFQDCYGWSVTQVRGAYKLHTIIWRQARDGQRMHDLMSGQIAQTMTQPTLEVHTVDIDAEWFQKEMEVLAAIRVPLAIQRPMGLDGESFGIHVPREFEVEWWCEGPPEWQELTKWAYECIASFRQKTAI